MHQSRTLVLYVLDTQLQLLLDHVRDTWKVALEDCGICTNTHADDAAWHVKQYAGSLDRGAQAMDAHRIMGSRHESMAAYRDDVHLRAVGTAGDGPVWRQFFPRPEGGDMLLKDMRGLPIADENDGVIPVSVGAHVNVYNAAGAYEIAQKRNPIPRGT